MMTAFVVLFITHNIAPFAGGLTANIRPVDNFVVPGLGVALLDVERMKFALERTPKIRRRLFTEDEISYCEKFRFAERHYAGRWAVKEAVTKALGCGLIQWNGVEVRRRPRQAPTVRIFGKMERFANMVGIREEDIQISITHSELSAVAVCIVRRSEPGHVGNS